MRQLRSAQYFQLLGQHIAALQIGNHQNVGLPVTGETSPLIAAAFTLNGR